MAMPEGRPGTATATREYVRFEVLDLNGKALSKTVPARHRASPVYMYAGATAFGANSEVQTFPEEIMSAGCPNAELIPDWTTEQVLPWAARPGASVSRVYCEKAAGGKRLAALPRTVCRRLLEELKAWSGQGLELLMGGEQEFTFAKKSEDGRSWKPLFTGVDIFATLQNNKAMDLCYEIEQSMEPVGVDIVTMNAEYGEGQVELVFAPKFGLAACDMVATFRTGTKEIAQRQGLLASFFTRPFGVSGVGNGGHFNFSLWGPSTSNGTAKAGQDALSKATVGKANVFHDARDAEGLSPLARKFLAGVLAHGAALEALCSPTPACATRRGNWAPSVMNWGPDDRLAAVRVKAERDGSADGCYMELRMPSAAANPYLVVAGVVAAGLDGLTRGLELPPARQTKEQGAVDLPTNLAAALDALEADTYMVGKLGADFVRWYTGLKRAELKAIEDKLAKGSRSDEELSAAWQWLYMEYV